MTRPCAAGPSLGLVLDDPAQLVLESDPFRRPAYPWHTFTHEWARAYGVDDEFDAARWEPSA